MRKIENKPLMFENMFSEARAFTDNLKPWIVASDFFLDKMNAEQLCVIRILELELLMNENRIYVSTKDESVKLLIQSLKTKKRVDKIELIPMWIRRIFKAN